MKPFVSSPSNCLEVPLLALPGVARAGTQSKWDTRPLVVVLGDRASTANLRFLMLQLKPLNQLNTS